MRFDTNKIGINYSKGAFGLSPEETFGLFSEIGFDSVFTGFYEVEQFAELARKNGLFYESVHAPFDKINSIWLPGEEGENMLSRLSDCVQTCGKFDVPVVVIHLSSGVKPPAISDAGRDRWDRLIETAVKNNVTLAFENQRKIANIAYILETYDDAENVGFCWDVGHEACFAEGREYMQLFGKKLVYTHIHDNFCEAEKDMHIIPFDGKIDFEKCARFLKKYDFKGTLTLELLPNHTDFYGGISPEEYYKKAYDAVNKIKIL